MSRALEALGLGLVLGILAGLIIGTSFVRAVPPPAQKLLETGLTMLGGGSPLAPERTEAPQPSPSAWPVGSAGARPDAESGGVSLPAAASQPVPSGTSEPVHTSPVPSLTAAVPGGTANRPLTVTGLASWYCSRTSPCTKGYPASGMFAAAGPALRVGNWRGRYVTVNGLRVRLVDWCQCPGGRVIDLYASVVRALGLPLSRGVYSVRVTW